MGFLEELESIFKAEQKKRSRLTKEKKQEIKESITDDQWMYFNELNKRRNKKASKRASRSTYKKVSRKSFRKGKKLGFREGYQKAKLDSVLRRSYGRRRY